MHKTARNFMSLTSITENQESSPTNTVWKMEEVLRSAFRRDSLISDAAHIERLAKSTTTQLMARVEEDAPDTGSPVKVKKVTSAFVRQVSIHDFEQEQTHLRPALDGRILKVDEKVG